MRRVLRVLLMVLMFGSIALAQAAKPISDVNHDKLLIAFQRATIIKQQAMEAVDAANKAQAAFKDAVADYQKAREEVVTKEKLAKGTDFQIDIATGTVTAVAPAAPQKTAPPSVSTQPTQ